MNLEQIEVLFARTLDDLRLSRGERRALRETLGESDLEGHDLDGLRGRAFALAQERLSAHGDHRVLEWLEDAIRLLTPRADRRSSIAETYFSPGDEGVQRLSSLIRHARQAVDVCVFTITDDRLSEALAEVAQRGVRVRILTDNDKAEDRGSDIDRLERVGIPVRVDRTEKHMHHKYAIFDRELLVTGSYNWTRSAARHNEENFIVTDEPRLVKPFRDAFRELWQQLA